MNSKAQITVFIILGLILLIGASTAIYWRMSSIDTLKAKTERMADVESGSLVDYVKGCIKREATPLITLMAFQGGKVSIERGRQYDAVSYRYICTADPSYERCNAIILTRQDMEQELASAIEPMLTKCINLTIFREQGMEITEGQLKASAVIAQNEVTVSLDYPLTVVQADTTMQLSLFQEKIALPLGRLYDISAQILNEEISKGFFDQDEWMLNHGAEIIIEKHRPYPDTVYSLTKTTPSTGNSLTFNFALEGVESVRDAGLQKTPLAWGICCHNSYDNTCFPNAIESQCTSKPGMTVTEKPSCGCPPPPAQALTEASTPSNKESCGGRPCKDCETTWDYSTQGSTGPKRKHGESWCVYDGPVGGGFDLVGSRHYKHSCIDGVEYTEECRDFREELCAEQNILGENPRSKALCRPNRWESCSSQLTKDSCENQEVRDCTWTDKLYDTQRPSYGLQRYKRCHPAVPPGLMHWELNGLNVCAAANEWRHCDGLNCPDQWVDLLSQYCYFQADCGNYRNTAGKVTNFGYVNTDNAERAAVYLDPSLLKSSNYKLGLRIETRAEAPQTGKEFDNPNHSPPEMLDAAMEYYSEASSWDTNDLLWEYVTRGQIDIYVFAAGICGPWQAPIGGSDCSICGASKNKPCTEYMCRSLGQDCIYEETLGTGECFSQTIDDSTPPEITFDSTALPLGYSSAQASFLGNTGTEVTPVIRQNTTFSFGVNTDEPAICVLTPLPNIGAYTLPSAISSFATGASTKNYTTSHKFIFNTPSLSAAYERLFDSTGVAGINNFLDLAEFANNYTEVLNRFSQEYGVDVSQQIRSLDKSMLKTDPALVQQTIQAASENRYRIFVRCTDRSGNTNAKSFFVLISIDKRTEIDTIPPALVNMTPANGSTLTGAEAEIKLTLDEPVECRYSFLPGTAYADSTNEMECVPAVTDIDILTAGKRHSCTTRISTAQFAAGGLIPVYVKCNDNPRRPDTYSIKATQSDSFRLADAKKAVGDRLLLLPPSTVLATAADVLRGDAKEVMANTTTIELMLNLTHQSSCRYSENPADIYDKMQPMSCAQQMCRQQLPADNRTYSISCARSDAPRVNTGSYQLSFLKAYT